MNTMRKIWLTELCNTANTPAVLMQRMIDNFVQALQVSLAHERDSAENFIRTHSIISLASLHSTLRALTQYTPDSPCVDRAQSLAFSLERQAQSGAFGDCGAYAVAVSALAEMIGFGVGEWVLVSTPAGNHIFNAFGTTAGDVIIDATRPDGFGLPWPVASATVGVRRIDPLNGTIIESETIA